MLTFWLSRSSYYYQRKSSSCLNNYGHLRVNLRKVLEKNLSCYGYRRLHTMLAKEGNKVSEKVIRRLMAEESLCAFSKKRRRYSLYRWGEISLVILNLFERDSQADVPKEEWLTDITEFAIPARE